MANSPTLDLPPQMLSRRGAKLLAVMDSRQNRLLSQGSFYPMTTASSESLDHYVLLHRLNRPSVQRSLSYADAGDFINQNL